MAKNLRIEPKLNTGQLSKKPLLYFNFPNSQKIEAYEYLINSAPLPKYEPSFDHSTEELLSQNSKSVKSLLDEASKHTNKKTAKKLQEIAFIKTYKQMYETGRSEPFMEAVKIIYGWPDEELFWNILEETIDHAYHHSNNRALLNEVQKVVNLRRAPDHPSAHFVRTRTKLFKETKALFKKAYSDELSLLRKFVATKPWVHRYSQEELVELFSLLVKYYKLDKQGWSIEIDANIERAMVNYELRTISVTPGSFRLSRPRAVGWALHEVGVHAQSRPGISVNAKALGERRIIEEGLGVFVEQMVFTRFQPVRHLRYIALGFALGIDGKPRNAKEVYEIIWRLRYLGGVAQNRTVAKEYAAKEVIRIFRGMPLDKKGVVITKDRAYIEGSQKIWAHIEENGPEFIFENLLGKKI
jgi:hypothetical protein